MALKKVSFLPSLLPQGELTRGKGAGNVDEALVGAAAETEADVALSLNEGAVNKDIQFLHDRQQLGILFYFLPGVAREAPHVIAQFLLDAVDEGAGAFGLLQGVSAAQRDGGLVIGNDLHQFVEGALLAALEVPRGGIMAAGAMVVTARHVD